MKILELRFKNLNSLYGEWLIDFSTPEFVSNGIFAITGPTGAGKSTILDAICLALYGATPRLGKITKSSNQLMSQQTAECYAEVTFESQQGRFTCHWSQHKARRKIDGTLGESKHEIIDTLTGHILESKKRDVAHVIEEKTGMDFERFTRSILLAQGGFAAFLMATPDERAPILEQITGTEIYGELSKRVHEKTRSERDKLHLLQAELGGITLLSAEQEETYTAELLEMKQQELLLIEEYNKLSTALTWLTNIDSLSNELTEYSKVYESLNQELILFEADRKKLLNASKAMELDGEYATLKELRKQHASEKDALAKEEFKTPELQTTVEGQNTQLDKREQQLTEVKNEQKKLSDIIKKIRYLDQQLLDKKQIINAGQSDIEKHEAEINAKTDELNKKKQLIGVLKEQQEAIRIYIKTHAEDATLVSQLTGIEEQLNHFFIFQSALVEKNKAVLSLEEQLKLAQKTLERYAQQESSHQSQLTDFEHQINQVHTDLNQLLGERLLREYRAEKESLLREMAFQKKIASLESERQKLEDGTPCPLCGSEDHPYAKNNNPQLDKTEIKIESLTRLIHQAEDLEQKIHELKAKKEDLRQLGPDISTLKLSAHHKKNQAEKELLELKKQGKQLAAELNVLEQEALDKLKKFSIKDLADSRGKRIVSELKARLKNWNAKEQERAKLEQEYIQQNSDIKPLEAIIFTLNSSLTEKKNKFECVNKECNELSTERQHLFGIKVPDVEEAKIELEFQSAEQAKNHTKNELELIFRHLEAAQTKIQTLKEQIALRDPQLNEKETGFIKALHHQGFKDEHQFISLCLPVGQRSALSKQAQFLDEKKTTLDSRISDRNERLAAEKKKQITDSNLDELKPIIERSNNNLNQIREQMTTLTFKLNKDNENKQHSKTKRILLEKQQIECTRMDKLHSLIGSSDGKKYRNFAQGITFELMVHHANKQLEKMTDRYLLIRDEEQPLELNVVDNYQAGEIRSTKNLSGGESFIVSLSLALGLSKMASQKVRVDSLFLDEGFGTLDDEALETALETLGELQQDGKIIGVISHVHALKERINTQINVQPLSSGKSSISGPGCEKLHRLTASNV